MLMPKEASACGLTSTRTEGVLPPLTVTRPTPGTSEIFAASRELASDSTSVRFMVFEVIASVMIGASAGFTFAYTGGAGRSAGSRLPVALIAACTSCSAISRLSDRSNCNVITEAPAELAEDIWFNPSISPNWRSSGAVMEDVITCGEAPG